MRVTDTHTTVETLYELHATELVRFATSLVGPHDAADLVSIVFVTALGGSALESAANPRAYLYRSVLNASHSESRSSARRNRREAQVAPPDRADHVGGSEAPSDPDVWSALGHLSERQRAVADLTYWMDLTPDAVAEMLAISTGSVKRHLDRARKSLRNSLGGHS